MTSRCQRDFAAYVKKIMPHLVTMPARTSGYMRPLILLQEQGLPGLIPKRPGPKQAHKLNDAVLDFIEQQQGADEVLRAAALAEMVLKKFHFSIHPRSIERALAKRRKKGL